MTARPSQKTMTYRTKPRKFKGFAVIERPDGHLVWGTFRPTEDEARAMFEKWNPPIEGHERHARVLPVEILVFDIVPPKNI
jgi:hypothetical protein